MTYLALFFSFIHKIHISIVQNYIINLMVTTKTYAHQGSLKDTLLNYKPTTCAQNINIIKHVKILITILVFK